MLISNYKKTHPEIPTLFHVNVCRRYIDKNNEISPRSRGDKLIRIKSFSLDYIKMNFNFCEKLEKKLNQLELNESFKQLKITRRSKKIFLYIYILKICELNITRLKKNYTIPMRNFNFLNFILETPIDDINNSINNYFNIQRNGPGLEFGLFKNNSNTKIKKQMNKMHNIINISSKNMLL